MSKPDEVPRNCPECGSEEIAFEKFPEEVEWSCVSCDAGQVFSRQCGEPVGGSVQDSLPDVDPPVAATVQYPAEKGDIASVKVEERYGLDSGTELYKKSDAEEAIQEARKQGIDEGLKEGWNVGRRIERQRVLNKITEINQTPEKGAECPQCGWKGHASEVDDDYMPSDMGPTECLKWACPECGEEAEFYELSPEEILDILRDELRSESGQGGSTLGLRDELQNKMGDKE